jgi:hypothetical protein
MPLKIKPLKILKTLNLFDVLFGLSIQMHGYSDLPPNDTSLSSLHGPPTGPCTPLSYLGNNQSVIIFSINNIY